jgi:hypothetical protein
MYQCHAVKLTSETNECQKSKFTAIYAKKTEIKTKVWKRVISNKLLDSKVSDRSQ